MVTFTENVDYVKYMRVPFELRNKCRNSWQRNNNVCYIHYNGTQCASVF